MRNYKEEFTQEFADFEDKGIVRYDEPLKEHCSFKIGGPADVFVSPEKQVEMVRLLKYAIQAKVPYMILGKGSNMLIGDKGVRGLIISTQNLKKLSRDEHCISAYSGVTLKDLCDFALESGLSGLEFASGIPGSVGGAVFMNAGAYEGEIKDVLYCSKYIKPDLSSLEQRDPIMHLKYGDHDFSYRHSVFQTSKYIHMSSVFKLQYAERDAIRDRMLYLEEQRNLKQPMELPSGGSVFKRPEGHFTGKLIDDCGLRGYQIGGAAISEKHCGFIVNLGGATAIDVLKLVKYAQGQVRDKFGVELEMELRLVGEF